MIDEFDCDWKRGKNRVRLTFNSHNLNNGNFYVRAVLFEYKEEGNVMIDELSTLENNYFFIAKRRDAGGGVLFIEHKWEKPNEK